MDDGAIGHRLSAIGSGRLTDSLHKHEPGLQGRARAGRGRGLGSRSGGPGEDSPASCTYLRRLLKIGFNASLKVGVRFLGSVDRLPPRAHQIVGLQRIDSLPAKDLAHELETRLELWL